jgi:bifunctional enzyme Fae/Hps
MVEKNKKLSPKKRYLQIALNGTISEAHKIILEIPKNDEIILEIGTPFIKRYGEQGIRQVCAWYHQRFLPDEATTPFRNNHFLFPLLFQLLFTKNNAVIKDDSMIPYIVADMKTIDRGTTEVEIAAKAGANAVIAMGTAPIETLSSFIEECEAKKVDSMIDMMNVEFPLSVLRKLKKPPTVVVLHRGVDEEKFNKEKQLPLYEIQRIKAGYNNVLIAVAGGDTVREVQRAFFNGANIAIIWKDVFQKTDKTVEIINGFLKQTK